MTKLEEEAKLSIDPRRIRNGACYVTANGQIRVVLKISKGKVWYAARGKALGKNWALPHTKANPPSIQTFAESVEKRVLPRPSDVAGAAKIWRKVIAQN